uniref:Uncharacterized protein n=1 Tax=Oryza meridionalis TaxID=40149 RepID=A0A0E0D015_9ORYZ
MWGLNEGSNSNAFKKVNGTQGHLAEPTEHHKLQSSSAPLDHRRHTSPSIIATTIEVWSSPDPGLDTLDLDLEGQIRPAFCVGTCGKPWSSPTRSPHSRRWSVKGCRRRAPQSPDPTGDASDLDLGRSDPAVPLAACPGEGGGHRRRMSRRTKPGADASREASNLEKRGGRKEKGREREKGGRGRRAAPPLPATTAGGGVAGSGEAGERAAGLELSIGLFALPGH